MDIPSNLIPRLHNCQGSLSLLKLVDQGADPLQEKHCRNDEIRLRVEKQGKVSNASPHALCNCEPKSCNPTTGWCHCGDLRQKARSQSFASALPWFWRPAPPKLNQKTDTETPSQTATGQDPRELGVKAQALAGFNLPHALRLCDTHGSKWLRVLFTGSRLWYLRASIDMLVISPGSSSPTSIYIPS